MGVQPVTFIIFFIIIPYTKNAVGDNWHYNKAFTIEYKNKI